MKYFSPVSIVLVTVTLEFMKHANQPIFFLIEGREPVSAQCVTCQTGSAMVTPGVFPPVDHVAMFRCGLMGFRWPLFSCQEIDWI